MRFTITPLGSTGGRTVGQVVDDIVRYLEPRAPERGHVPQGRGPSSYYADRGTEPGRWLGNGASESLLIGSVDPDDFSRVMAGRDPHTGARLITAQGSAGRRPTLGSGNRTRLDERGVPLYDATDAAATLGITRGEAEALIAAGERAAFDSLMTLTTGGRRRAEPDASFAVPIIDQDGNRWITQTELTRVEDARSMGVAPAQVEEAGAPDDQLSIAEAARLSGLTSQYLRSLCRRYDNHCVEIDEAVEAGRTPKRAYLIGHRGTRNQWLVTRGNLVAYLHRRVAPAVRVGYDLTLTTEKSLGVLALLGDDRTRSAVLDAIQAGNDLGLHHLEYRAVTARAKGSPAGIRGWTVASFRHLTSRALDPFPHHHNVVANTVVDEYGTRRALDARTLYWNAQEASALATAEMRHRLSEALGVRWRPSRSGGWEIDGIDDEVVREFSRRRNEIDDAIAELEEAIGRQSNLDEVQRIITNTRPDKTNVDPGRLVDGWWTRARAHGLTPAGLACVVGRAGPIQDLDHEDVFRRLVDPTTGVCAGVSTFTRADAIAALVDLPVPGSDGREQPLLLPADEIERLADHFLASDHVVPLDLAHAPGDSAVSRAELFSTTEILAVQQRILTAYDEGPGAGIGAVAPDGLTQVLDDAALLSDEQRELVTSLCSSGSRVQCAIGRAGTGKTTSMRTAARAWEHAGWTVVGAAVKGEAARHLHEGAGIPTETVAWYLARRDKPSLPLDDRTVLIIDEASTLSDRDLDALLQLAVERGAIVRLIGDPAQHGAVAAGGMFAYLCSRDPARTPELTTAHRLLDRLERDAVEALRLGDIDRAIEGLTDAGKVHVADNDTELYIGMLQRWWSAHRTGDHHPMVDRRHHTRQTLNRLARRLLRSNGELGDAEIESSHGRAFSVGDRVVSRMAARHLHLPDDPTAYVRNGAAGIVVEVAPGRVPAGDRLRVDFDGIGVVDIPRQFFDEHEGPGGRRDVGIDHAYAVTSYAVQGATFTTSTSRIDEHASRAETYVDLTRGREANHLFLSRAAEPLDGEHLPKVPPPPLAEAVIDRLKRSGPERPAIELDPTAASLAAGDERGPDETAATALRLVAARARLLAPHHPPIDLADRLPPVGSVPFLHRKRRTAISEIVEYRTSHRFASYGPYAWAHGGPGVDPSPDWRRVAEILDDLAAADAHERLRLHGREDIPEWMTEHLRARFAAGNTRWLASDALDLLDRVTAFRDVFADSDHLALLDASPPLGPAPTDPARLAAYQLLAHELAIATDPARSQTRGLA